MDRQATTGIWYPQTSASVEQYTEGLGKSELSSFGAHGLTRSLAILNESPKISGMGSPGMEMGGHRDAYDVILFKDDGSQEIYSHH